MEKKIGKLVLVRHGESEWNKLGLWTGLTDVHLSEHGGEEAREMGELVRDIDFDYVFTSALVRAEETLTYMEDTDGAIKKAPVEEAKELNERDYGIYTGKNKWEVEKEVGEEEFEKIRRGWDTVIPKGENLKMVYERAVPFFLKRILPMLKDGKNILVVAHGNSIRSIIKYLENISDQDIVDVEMPFEEILIYELDENGHSLKKEVRKIK